MGLKDTHHSEKRIETGKDFTLHLYLDYFNNRLKVEDYRGNIKSLTSRLNELVSAEFFTKTVILSKRGELTDFINEGYQLEAIFPNYFNGSDAYAMIKFADLDRSRSEELVKENLIFEKIKALPKDQRKYKFPDKVIIREATVDDVHELAVLYDYVFTIYPTPIKDPNYIEKSITEGNIYYVVEENKKIVAAATAEVSATYFHAEISNCATLPEYRGKGYMKALFQELEKELVQIGIFCVFSLARALSTGMNAVLHQLYYGYYGRMVKNCYIFDKLEDMNVWVKDLSAEYPAHLDENSAN